MTDWLVDHKVSVMGGPPKRTRPSHIVTNSTAKVEPGDRIWLISRADTQSPHRLWLTFLVQAEFATAGRWRRRIEGRETFWFVAQPPVSPLPWFPALWRRSGYLRRGPYRVSDPTVVSSLIGLVP